MADPTHLHTCFPLGPGLPASSPASAKGTATKPERSLRCALLPLTSPQAGSATPGQSGLLKSTYVPLFLSCFRGWPTTKQAEPQNRLAQHPSEPGMSAGTATRGHRSVLTPRLRGRHSGIVTSPVTVPQGVLVLWCREDASGPRALDWLTLFADPQGSHAVTSARSVWLCERPHGGSSPRRRASPWADRMLAPQSQHISL